MKILLSANYRMTSLALRILLLLNVLVTAGNSDDQTKNFSNPSTTHDSHLYLFVDDNWIDKTTHLERVLQQPQPLATPVIWPDDPLTQDDAAWGTVIREKNGLFRMWYFTLMSGDKGDGCHEMAKAGVWGRGKDFSFHPRSPADVRATETALGKYAESIDGIHWKKPDLGLIEFRGSKQNNIILNGKRAAQQTGGALTNFDGYSIIRDDDEPDPNKRYKMLSHWESIHCHDNKTVSGSLGRSREMIQRFHKARGKYITYSPDGLQWNQPIQRIEFPDGGGDRFFVVPDHRHNRFFGYSRAGGHVFAAFSYSKNLQNWTEPILEKLITAKAIGAPKLECIVPFNYGNQDLGVAIGMDKKSGEARSRGMTSYLVSHHDGQPWKFVNNRKLFFPMGKPGSYYATGSVLLNNEPFLVGNELLFFFNAFSRNQNPPSPYGKRSIGVAKLRRDGFVGIQHSQEDPVGLLKTNSIKVSGKKVAINIQPGEGGHVAVALFDSKNNPIPGYGFKKSIPIDKDGVRVPLTWKGNTSRNLQEGEEIRIAIQFHGDVTLYSIAFVD